MTWLNIKYKVKKSVYFIQPVAGPVNGVKMINRCLLENAAFKNVRIIDTAQAKSSEEFGKFNLHKITQVLSLAFQLIKLKPKSYCYLNFTPHGFAYWRDLIFLKILLLKNCAVTIHVHANITSGKLFDINKHLSRCRVIVINEKQYKQFKPLLPNTYWINNALPNINEQKNKLIEKDIQKLNLLYLSNLSVEKGYYTLLNLYRKLKQEFPEDSLSLTIAGSILDEDIRRSIEEETAADKSIKYIGEVKGNKAKSCAFSKADLFLFLSRPYYEVSPLVLIEALMFGLPIIMTEQVVSPHIILKGNGIIINDDNEKEVTAYIAELFTNYNSRLTAYKNSLATYENNYNFDNFAAALYNVIVKD